MSIPYKYVWLTSAKRYWRLLDWKVDPDPSSSLPSDPLFRCSLGSDVLDDLQLEKIKVSFQGGSRSFVKAWGPSWSESTTSWCTLAAWLSVSFISFSVCCGYHLVYLCFGPSRSELVSSGIIQILLSLSEYCKRLLCPLWTNGLCAWIIWFAKCQTKVTLDLIFSFILVFFPSD